MAPYNTLPFNLSIYQFPSSTGVKATDLMCVGSLSYSDKQLPSLEVRNKGVKQSSVYPF